MQVYGRDNVERVSLLIERDKIKQNASKKKKIVYINSQRKIIFTALLTDVSDILVQYINVHNTRNNKSKKEVAYENRIKRIPGRNRSGNI